MRALLTVAASLSAGSDMTTSTRLYVTLNRLSTCTALCQRVSGCGRAYNWCVKRRT